MLTSFRNLRKGQASAPLQIDVLGIDQGTQCSKGFTREEVCFGSLQTNELTDAKRWKRDDKEPYILQVAQQVGYGFPFVIGQGGLINAIPRATSDRTQTGGDMAPAVDSRQTGQTCIGDSSHNWWDGPAGPAAGPASSELRQTRRTRAGWAKPMEDSRVDQMEAVVAMRGRE